MTATPWLRCLALALILAMAPVHAQEFDWLAGHWCNATSEELWLPERGGLLLGLNRSEHGSRTGFEFLRIEIDASGVRYQAQPGGRPPTAFELADTGARSVEFRNPAHDYPRRIRYWRDGNDLHATIDDGDGGREIQFTWTLCTNTDAVP